MADPDIRWLADRFTKLLTERKLTLQRVSAETGINRAYLSLMKTGRQVPSEELLRRLAAYLGEDPEEWAFHVRGLPVLKELEERYPHHLPAYGRKTWGPP